MTVRLPNGGVFAIASAYSAPVVVTGISNTNPAVVSATGHGFVTGDIVEMTSGWSKLNNRVVRVGAVTAGTFELEGVDATSVLAYPAGTGMGAAREVQTFTQIQQVLSTNTSGGDQNFYTFQFIESDEESEIPTNKTPRRLTMTLGDDPSLPGYIEVAKANEDRLVRAIRFSLAGGGFIFYNGFVSVNETPTTTTNEIMQTTMTVAIQGRPTRYAA